jgi:hypothetical protein
MEQLTAQEKAAKQVREVEIRNVIEAKDFKRQQGRLILDTVEELRIIEDDIRNVKKQMGDRQWQLAITQRELANFRNVSFKTYLKKLASFRKR